MTLMKPRRTEPAHVPGGQPEAYPRTRVIQGKGGKEYPRFVYPHQVIRIRSKADLEKELEHYSHPFPAMDGATATPKTVHARRHLVEWIYPALRWFCKVYHHPIPKWLSSHNYIHALSNEEIEKYFGKDKLRVQEFKEKASRAGERM